MSNRRSIIPAPYVRITTLPVHNARGLTEDDKRADYLSEKNSLKIPSANLSIEEVLFSGGSPVNDYLYST